MAMDNGTSIRDFNCLTAGSKSMSRDIGFLLPIDNPLTRDVGALSGNIETSSANHFCCLPTSQCGDDWNIENGRAGPLLDDFVSIVRTYPSPKNNLRVGKQEEFYLTTIVSWEITETIL